MYKNQWKMHKELLINIDFSVFDFLFFQFHEFYIFVIEFREYCTQNAWKDTEKKRGSATKDFFLRTKNMMRVTSFEFFWTNNGGTNSLRLHLFLSTLQKFDVKKLSKFRNQSQRVDSTHWSIVTNYHSEIWFTCQNKRQATFFFITIVKILFI